MTINTHKYTILLAEDNEANQALLERMLHNAGHTVTAVSNGQEALDELCLKKFDLCIIDIQMPVLDGLETISLFKQRYPTNNLPFIILTADESAATIEKCNEQGAFYLAKPVRTGALLKAVSDVLLINNDITAEAEEKIIDISQFDYFNDQVFLDKFIELFEESCEKLTASLQTACNKDYEGFKKTVHTIKGLSGNIHANALRQITIEAESLDEEGYNNKSDEYYSRIKNELEKARIELSKLSSKK